MSRAFLFISMFMLHHSASAYISDIARAAIITASSVDQVSFD